MRTHYYFGWFNAAIPKEVVYALNDDILDKRSLVIISSIPADYEYTDKMFDFARDIWFEPAGVSFERYSSIDYRTEKKTAHELIHNASAILLHGGHPDLLNKFLIDYELSAVIEKSNASVIMGASAGGMNMGAKWVNRRTNPPEVRDGLGFDHLAVNSHVLFEDAEALSHDEYTVNYLMPLSKSIDVYVACEESTIRIKNGRLDVMGHVYLIADSNIQKLDETLNQTPRWDNY